LIAENIAEEGGAGRSKTGLGPEGLSGAEAQQSADWTGKVFDGSLSRDPPELLAVQEALCRLLHYPEFDSLPPTWPVA
jgi:hypothetical protein